MAVEGVRVEKIAGGIRGGSGGCKVNSAGHGVGMKFLMCAAAMLAMSVLGRADEKNEKCPLMVSEDIDEEQLIEYEGVKVYFCCQHCRKIWNRNQKYIIKASLELLPQFEDLAEKLELGKVELLAQRFCPVNPTHLVTPDSPTVEYKGEKIYFWDDEAVEKWKGEPEVWAKRAGEAGLLPQLKKKDGGK